ncbi:MAG TPA: hypothetical protein VFS39_05085 [Nitrospira sp.]|nr:hypothetical protein [Nitrospira sp.]
MAAELQAHAIVVERPPNDFVVVAASPWKPTLQVLDRLALDSCFRSAGLAGWGSDRSAGSDWLFVPVFGSGEVAAALGIAGRFCRRRFDVEEYPAITLAAGALEGCYAEAPRAQQSKACIRR